MVGCTQAAKQDSRCLAVYCAQIHFCIQGPLYLTLYTEVETSHPVTQTIRQVCKRKALVTL